MTRKPPTAAIATLLRDLPTARTDEAQRQAWLERKRALLVELGTCPHGWHVQPGEGCPTGGGCNEGRVT